MRVYFVMVVLIIVTVSTNFAQANTCGNPVKLTDSKKVKKISVVSSNNFQLTDDYKHLAIQSKYDDKDLEKLKAYVLKNSNLGSFTGPETIIRSLEWVSTQWEHDGMNQAPSGISSYQILMNVRKGERYRCVEYGKVLADLLQSLGYISRKIGLKTADVAYGGFGMGHVASEVWINSLRKWIFVDPQFGIYVKHQDKLLNFYDMYLLKKAGMFDDIDFIPTDGYLKFHKASRDKVVDAYKNFINNYFGFVESGYKTDDDTGFTLSLPLEGISQPLTFQGQSRNNVVFTESVDMLYPSINEVLILFSYREKVDFNMLVKKHKIKTNDDYLQNMHFFSALPKYDLKFMNSMPWFDHYEVMIGLDLKWEKVKEDTYKLDLIDGLNTFRVRAVNKAGLPGPITKMRINYK